MDDPTQLWRLGRPIAVHVYAGSTPVASFLGEGSVASANAVLAVTAVNALPAAQRLAGRLAGVQAALLAHAHRYTGLAAVFRATAGGNAVALAGVYADVAELLERLALNLTDDDPPRPLTASPAP